MNYGSEVISTTQYALPDNMSAGCSGNGAIGKYIYMIAGRKGNLGSSSGVISRFNTETGEIEDVYTLGDWLAGTFCVVDNKIYCFGGTHKKAFVFDTVSNTLTDLAGFPDNYYNYPCCVYYKGNIYIYGGFENNSAYIYINIFAFIILQIIHIHYGIRELLAYTHQVLLLLEASYT